MKTKLSVLERIRCMDLLPSEANYFTLKLVRKLKSELALDERETKEIELKFENDKAMWNQEKDPMKEIEFSDSMFEAIVNKLKEFDNSKKLTEEFSGLYEKFVLKA